MYGSPFVLPPVILKSMLQLVLYNVPSERELVDALIEGMGWNLWFLRSDPDTSSAAC